jgi:MFS family permease
MRPITREIIDRRQPIMSWGAVFAGAIVSVALWVVLQMLGMGVGLAAIHVDDAGSLRDVGIGTTVWTLAAPFVAMFVGGSIAGRLSGSAHRTVGAMHGFVMWAVTSVVGLLATVAMVSLLAAGALRAGAAAFGPEIDQQTVASTQDLATATDATGKILLGAGISQLIALATALLGGAAAVRRTRRVVETEVITPSGVVPAVVP